MFSYHYCISFPYGSFTTPALDCTVPFPQLHLVDSSLSTNISFSYDLSQSVGFNPRWCINGTNAENPGLWPNLTFTFETNHRETIFTYTNPSPSDTVNGLILYLVNQLESECTNLLKAVSIKSGTGNSTARWILLYIFEGMSATSTNVHKYEFKGRLHFMMKNTPIFSIRQLSNSKIYNQLSRPKFQVLLSMIIINE